MHLGIIKITYIYIYSSDAFKAVQLIQFRINCRSIWKQVMEIYR